MFDFTNVEKDITLYIENNFIDVILESVSFLIHKEMYNYLSEMDKRVSGSGMRFYLKSEYKV